MMRKNFLLIVLAVFFSLSLRAQIPAGYYNNATGLTGNDLQLALYNIIKNHTVISYDNLWNAYQDTDKQPNGKVWDMYSNCNFTFVSNQCGNYNSECDCYNREHSMPKSWFNDASPMVSDIFHVVPTDGWVNSHRSNYPFGEVTNATYTSANGSKVGNCSYTGYSGLSFEPIDEYKGDFARTYFYMACRYANIIANWKNNAAPYSSAFLAGNQYPAYQNWAISMLMEWHYNDPVSQKEIDRNNQIYYNYQHNRNPFIDHPEYAAQMWPTFIPAGIEPSNFPTNVSTANITLNWTDATGSVLPTGYLVRISSAGYSSIAAPADGVPVTNSTTALNVLYGVQTATFKNLAPNTVYYCKLFAYTGNGTSIDYKTDGTIPQVQIITSP
jgi:endonuclease I